MTLPNFIIVLQSSDMDDQHGYSIVELADTNFIHGKREDDVVFQFSYIKMVSLRGRCRLALSSSVCARKAR